MSAGDKNNLSTEQLARAVMTLVIVAALIGGAVWLLRAVVGG